MQDQHTDRDELYRSLSSAVEEIQAQVAQGSDVIWNCSAVDKLCFCVEDIFNHGLKEGLLSWASNNQVSFWSLANKITCKKDIEDINRLRLKSDQERCLAWIRQGLKENTLSSYLNVITQDEKLLREFYHSHAFLCDREKAEKVKDLITYGISHLDFDISFSSSSRRHTEVEAQPVIVGADAMISHLPERSSLVNGYGSPSSSWNGREHSAHWYSQETGSLKIEEPGKKRKKKKKAGVAMIAESADVEESHYIDKVIQMHREFDLESSNKEIKTIVTVDDQSSEKSKITDSDFSSALDREGETSSEISLTMELPVTETLLQKFITEKLQQSSSVVPEPKPTLSSAVVFEEVTVKEIAPHEEKVHHDEDILNTVEGKSEESDLTTEDPDLKVKSDQSTAYEQLSEDEANLVEDTRIACLPEVEYQSSSQNPFEGLTDDEINASHKVAEEENVTNENETTEHFAALAAFECGTPKQVDSIWQIEKERAMSNTSYEGEDLNIIPGIHKNLDRHSLSGSSGSYNGSGSFQLGSQRSSRNNTLDSVYQTSTFGSSVTSDSWPYRSGSSSRKNSKADIGFTVESPSSEFSEYEMFDELLGLEEDHFSPPESFMGVSTSEELQHAIDACKDLINTTPEDSEEKNKLVNKLVQLRLKLQETQDSKTANDSSARKILSHVFVKEEDAGKKLSCDKCGKAIWMWQSLFTCKACNYHSHRRCLELIRRPCASRKVSVSTYNLRICPETGLSSQQYKCAECRKQIGLTRGERSEARLCDYTGQYFCEECHWNDLVVIPARVVHNWDFTTYRVSRQSKQFLALMLTRPLLKIEKLNPALFKFVVELREIKRLREEILIMKKYFVTCREALESKLLLQLKNRQHFVDSANIYSLEDLVDVNSGLLLPFLTRIHSLFLTHIKSDCQTINIQKIGLYSSYGTVSSLDALSMSKLMNERSSLLPLSLELLDRCFVVIEAIDDAVKIMVHIAFMHKMFLTECTNGSVPPYLWSKLCQAKGFVCEICGKDEIIFALDPHATQCKQCRAVFHKICFKSGWCPKCERRQKRSHKT